MDLLRECRGNWRGRTLFATSDDALTLLSRNHEELSANYRVACEPWGRMEAVVRKDAMHHLAERAGLDVPRCWGRVGETAVGGEEPTFPVVVKPVFHDRLIDHLRVKALLADGPEELEEVGRELKEIGSTGLVFEKVPGADSEIFVHCFYVDSRGEPSAGVTVRKDRQAPPEVGSARVARIVDTPARIREASVELMRTARLRGPAFVEFKRDARTGSMRFIEINCRSALYGSLTAAGGADLVRATWQDYAAGEAVRMEPNGWRGYWIQLQADFGRSLLHGRGEGLRMREFARPYRAPHIYAVLSAKDPCPFALQSLLLLRRLTLGETTRASSPDVSRDSPG